MKPPPVADHIVCMACGSFYQHGWHERHYQSLHPDLVKLYAEGDLDDDYTVGGMAAALLDKAEDPKGVLDSMR